MNTIKLGKKIIDDNSLYFIADIGANHNGSLEKAIELIHLAKESGADAAKFQNFKAETIVSDYGFKSLATGKQLSHQSSWKKSVFEVYQGASLPIEWTKELSDTCRHAGIDYFTSPYDMQQIEELDKYVCAWKIGSGDITWHKMIELLMTKDKPIFIATGASDIKDVDLAMQILLKKKSEIVLMQCNTNYTADIENFKHINLNVIKLYSEIYPDILLGLSDHTPGHSTVLGAIALGARVIEKHFTDDNSREGPDHKFSMNPKTWKEMVERSRELEAALGNSKKFIAENEIETVVLQRRSIRAKKNLIEGSIINEDDLISLRPCPNDAIPPYNLNLIVGKKIIKTVLSGDYIKLSDIE